MEQPVLPPGTGLGVKPLFNQENGSETQGLNTQAGFAAGIGGAAVLQR